MNVQPVKLPLFVNAQLGFMAVYLLADYDDLARKLILAHHTALIDRSTLERWLNDGAHALRSLFSLAQQYRYSGTRSEEHTSELQSLMSSSYAVFCLIIKKHFKKRLDYYMSPMLYNH